MTEPSTPSPSPSGHGPLTMRRLRAGGAHATGEAVTPGAVINTAALARSLDAAIATARVDETLVMVWTVRLRPLPLTQWGRPDPPSQAALAPAVADRLLSLDTPLVFAGGAADEITGFVFGLRRRDDADRVASELLVALRRPLEVDGQLVHVDARIGTAMVDGDAPDGPTALAASRLAAEAADATTPHRSSSRRLHDRRRAVEELRRDLEAAVAADALDVSYQPIVTTGGGHLIGIEAFVRWDHPDRGPVRPGEFLPLIERSPLIYALGDQVLRRAYATVAGWIERDLIDAITLWVNVTPTELLRPDFARRVRSVADPALPISLGIGLGEGPALGEKAVSDVVRALALDDVRAAVDEFGADYSVIETLRRLPFDTVRLRRDLIGALEAPAGGEDGRLALQLVTELARRRGLTVIAAGVETPEQLAAVTELGVDAVQGYHLAPPMAAAELADRLPAERWPTDGGPAASAPASADPTG